MYPHRIRLRGPWEYETADRRGHVVMPCRLGNVGLDDFVGPIRFRRRFGRPAHISLEERIWLTCAGLTGTARFSMNQHDLGTFQSEFALELLAPLKYRNVLEVELSAATVEQGLWGETALEVRRTAYLENVATRSTNDGVSVSGRVVGTADGPLDLYVLRDRTTVHHQMITPGEEFHVQVRPGTMRIELVQGATVWYAIDP